MGRGLWGKFCFRIVCQNIIPFSLDMTKTIKSIRCAAKKVDTQKRDGERVKTVGENFKNRKRKLSVGQTDIRNALLCLNIFEFYIEYLSIRYNKATIFMAAKIS